MATRRSASITSMSAIISIHSDKLNSFQLILIDRQRNRRRQLRYRVQLSACLLGDRRCQRWSKWIRGSAGFCRLVKRFRRSRHIVRTRGLLTARRFSRRRAPQPYSEPAEQHCSRALYLPCPRRTSPAAAYDYYRLPLATGLHRGAVCLSSSKQSEVYPIVGRFWPIQAPRHLRALTFRRRKLLGNTGSYRNNRIYHSGHRDNGRRRRDYVQALQPFSAAAIGGDYLGLSAAGRYGWPKLLEHASGQRWTTALRVVPQRWI